MHAVITENRTTLTERAEAPKWVNILAAILVFPIVFVMVVALPIWSAVSWYQGQEAYKALHIQDWKSADGVVKEAPKYWVDGGGRTTYHHWYYKLSYEYKIDTSVYSGDKLFYESLSGLSMSEGTNRDPHLKAGDHITVWYDPNNPDRAVLDRNLQGNADWQYTNALHN